jgi:hypothetical protein
MKIERRSRMKRVINLLYRDPTADLGGFKDEHVQSAHDALTERLATELGKVYRWLAVCTVAVEAGYWGGERRRKRRIKLLAMINQCRTRLGMDPVLMEDSAWASVGLYYGYGATHSYGQDHGLDRRTPFILGLLDSHGPETAQIAADLIG